MNDNYLPILQVGNVLLSADIITELFCCDYDTCKGICCVEGSDGAPVSLDEIDEIEQSLDAVWNDISAQAQAVIDRQGVAYIDRDGDTVTSIVGGKDCVFTCYENGYCLCSLEKRYRKGKTNFCKPMSCRLYPIREKRFANDMIGLNFHRWDICKDAFKKGKKENIRVYQFLKEPLTARFGEKWYEELCVLADEIGKNQQK